MVRLTGIVGNVLFIEDVDILDGTPLLDIKLYVPAFDSYPDCVRLAGQRCKEFGILHKQYNFFVITLQAITRILK